MNPKPFLGVLLTVSFFWGLVAEVRGQGTAFTYQGVLNLNGAAASGNYDFRFGLYNNSIGGSPVSSLITNSGVLLTNGQFTVALDFSNVFNGGPYWLEISTRSNLSSANFTALNPRQPITAAPYAVTASNLTGTLPANQVTGTLQAAQFPAALPAIDGGNVTDLRASALVGTIPGNALSPALQTLNSNSGANLTGLNASQLTTGIAGLANGGTGISVTNLIPFGAVYDATVDGGNLGPAYAVSLTNGVTYTVSVPGANGNDQGIYDNSFAGYGPATGTGIFTVPSTGTYYALAITNGTPVLITLSVAAPDTNIVVFNKDLTANNITGNSVSGQRGGFTSLSFGGVDANSAALLSPLITPEKPLHIFQGQSAPDPAGLADGSVITSTNTFGYGSTLFLNRVATNGYADIGFFTNGVLQDAIGVAASPNLFPYSEFYFEDYSANDMVFVHYPNILGGLRGSTGGWRWFDNFVNSSNTSQSEHTIFEITPSTSNVFISSVTVGASTNTASFTLTQTNFISGQLYTNLTGRPLQVSATAQCVTAAVSGFSQLSLLMPGYLTNVVCFGTVATSLSVTNQATLYGIVPAGVTYTFTNTSSGLGNSASVLGGQCITL